MLKYLLRMRQLMRTMKNKEHGGLEIQEVYNVSEFQVYEENQVRRRVKNCIQIQVENQVQRYAENQVPRRIEKQEEVQRAKNYALRSLGIREQSEAQIRQKLSGKCYSDAVIEQVLDYLRDYNYVNDERFVEQYIVSHCHRMNRMQLKNRLYSLGFADIDIDSYLTDLDYDETEILRKEFESYIRKKEISDYNVRNKIMMHFVNKGYSAAQTRKLLEEYQMSLSNSFSE